MLMLERFIVGGGWLELIIISIYGAFLAIKMQDQKQSPKWRLISWSIFSIFFFSQLILGILVSDKFLLTGKLHIPVPAMMIAGPVYRGQLSIMTLLFLSTILLSGPAWCSHLCYFGAADALVAKRKKANKQTIIKKLWLLKGIILVAIVTTTLLLRYFGINPRNATIIGIFFGLCGALIIILLSSKRGQMVHCIAYCPVGTLVNVFKYVSPFRMTIDKKTCTLCQKCTPTCMYGALNLSNIKQYKQGITCTLCGDCLSACKDNSIQYKFLNLSPEKARQLYLFITISLHAIFLAMGRI